MAGPGLKPKEVYNSMYTILIIPFQESNLSVILVPSEFICNGPFYEKILGKIDSPNGPFIMATNGIYSNDKTEVLGKCQ